MLQLYPIGISAALTHAVQILKHSGLEIVDHPTPEVTHLLLDVPSFTTEGLLRNGIQPQKILETLPPYITVVGGNLDHSALEGYRTWDLLQDPRYLALNAAITADCAMQIAAPLLKTTFRHCPALILGWGRIGKCLGQLLRGVGAQVTIAARKPEDRAMIDALGYQAADPYNLQDLPSYRILFNTVPQRMLTQAQLSPCRNCVKIDLASIPGLEGEDVVWARGLPGIHAPESSGKLIAETFLQKLKEEKV